MTYFLLLTTHELAVLLASLRRSPIPSEAKPVWTRIVSQVGHPTLPYQIVEVE